MMDEKYVDVIIEYIQKTEVREVAEFLYKLIHNDCESRKKANHLESVVHMARAQLVSVESLIPYLDKAIERYNDE